MTLMVESTKGVMLRRRPKAAVSKHAPKQHRLD